MDLTVFRRVLLDTSACIYFLDGTPESIRHRLMVEVIELVERDRITVVLSPITVAELLVLPIREHSDEAEALVHLFVASCCQVMPATTETAAFAAALRCEHGLRLPDAFILATGLEHSVDTVIGNDDRWKRVHQITYIHLDDEPDP